MSPVRPPGARGRALRLRDGWNAGLLIQSCHVRRSWRICEQRDLGELVHPHHTGLVVLSRLLVACRPGTHAETLAAPVHGPTLRGPASPAPRGHAPPAHFATARFHCIALVCISAIIITTFAVIWEGHSADSAIYDILELQILPFFIIARLLHPLVYELNE